jgi:hypothetical protein
LISKQETDSLVVDWRAAAAAATETFLPISATINNQVIRGVAMSSRGRRIDGVGHGGSRMPTLLPKTRKNACEYRIPTVMAGKCKDVFWDWHLNATLF